MAVINGVNGYCERKKRTHNENAVACDNVEKKYSGNGFYLESVMYADRVDNLEERINCVNSYAFKQAEKHNDMIKEIIESQKSITQRQEDNISGICNMLDKTVNVIERMQQDVVTTLPDKIRKVAIGTFAAGCISVLTCIVLFCSLIW